MESGLSTSTATFRAETAKTGPTSFKEPHVAVLFSRIGPYHFARLKAAAARLRVTAVEFSNVDPVYAWDLVEGQEGFERLMLFSGLPLKSQSATRIFEEVDKALSNLQPAAVAIPGWYDRPSLSALKWCARHAVPAIIMSETTAWDDERKAWREIIKKRVVRLCSAGLVGGKNHADYLAQLGMAGDRVFLGYDAVDNDYFADKAKEFSGRKSEIRNQFRLPERYFLASARFVGKKNLDGLIRAYARYRELAQKPEVRGQKSDLLSPSADLWSLVLLGDGPLKSDLCRLISDLSLQEHVLMPGFKQYADLPTYYALASAFVHASATEQWGLVVNEAMASGLPVLVSDRCGCAADLVHEGRNGFTFDPLNTAQLAQLMVKISALNFPLFEFASASREIAGEWGASAFGEGLYKAASSALRLQRIQSKLFDRLFLDWLVRGLTVLSRA
jgi:glycosyltransferase involved in cell wall biosynthesis